MLKRIVEKCFFVIASLFYKHVVYLKSGNYKSGFSGEKSILAYNLCDSICIKYDGDYVKMQQWIDTKTKCGEIVFCVCKYEASDFTMQIKSGNFLGGDIFGKNTDILLMTFKKVIIFKNSLCNLDFLSKILNFLPKICKLQNSIRATLTSNMTDGEYKNNIENIITRIKNGDFLQTNVTRKYFGFTKVLLPSLLFLRLCRKSNVFYSSFIKFNGEYILCLSPERFLHKNGNVLTTNPIKGSVKSMQNNALIEKELFNEKNKAENLMITDLMRNDFYKICDIGSVKTAVFNADIYKNIAHLSSQISGVLRDEFTLNDILKATLPIGSMTGAPKKIASFAAANAENAPRGVYSGFIGYFTANGFDLAVSIRCLLLKKTTNYGVCLYGFETQSGGGITALSNPSDELMELENKITFILNHL